MDPTSQEGWEKQLQKLTACSKSFGRSVTKLFASNAAQLDPLPTPIAEQIDIAQELRNQLIRFRARLARSRRSSPAWRPIVRLGQLRTRFVFATQTTAYNP